MEKVTDWIALWRVLVEKNEPLWNCKQRSEANRDKWKNRAKSFYTRFRERWSKSDPIRDLIVSMISSVKDATVLDIGAGTGAWAVLLSKSAGKVTAIEPSADMRQILSENLKNEGIDNVEILDEFWPVSGIEPHDFSLSCHSVYDCEDLRSFVSAMSEATRHTCFMLLRAPDHNGLMAKAANRIWGQPYDSPNFQVAYNAMLQMGMFPNVLMEEKGKWPGWINTNLEEALDLIKSSFGIEKVSEHDPFLRDLLKKKLKEEDGKVRWPSEVRTGLVYWETKKKQD